MKEQETALVATNKTSNPYNNAGSIATFKTQQKGYIPKGATR